ncbi:hypothetical protein ScPMuIL_012852 [Solemya velum]
MVANNNQSFSSGSNMLNCHFVTPESVECNGTVYTLPEQMLTYLDEWFWIYLSIYVGLVLLAGLMSGLTMGLLSLDTLTLNVLKEGGTPKEKKYASRIISLVKNHHLLLVTLLLANACAVEAMPIFLDKISDPITAIVVSVSAVLVFGEVVPQAVCTRFGLAIGATLAPFVYFLIGLLFIIAWPLSKVLDCCLGKNHTTFFRRAELKVLVDLHSQNKAQTDMIEDHDRKTDEKLTLDEVLIIKGALDMKHKTVHHAMVPLSDVFMLPIECKFDMETMNKVLHYCHSRIPVYEGERSNIVGLLLIKMLIKLDPDDATPVKDLLSTPSLRNVLFVEENLPLFDLLNIFQTGKSHLGVVRRKRGKRTELESPIHVDSSDTVPILAECPDTLIHVTPPPEEDQIIGIITLEDVIEELIQEEIIDESDIYVDMRKRLQVARVKAARQLSTQTHREQVQRSQSHPPLDSSTALAASLDGSMRNIQEDDKSKSAEVVHYR